MAGSQIAPATAMVLAAAATTGAKTRPSGESPQAQTARIAQGIEKQLEVNAPGWVPMWIMMSPDNANLAYIASNEAANQAVVAIRGTNANITDVMEDLAVGTVVPFWPGGTSTPLTVSKGAMTAFTEIVNTSAPGGGGLLGGSLTAALTQVLAGLSDGATVFVVGHSLGGCVATMVAPYLQALSWQSLPTFGILTFAAPTAGLGDFAAYFDTLIDAGVWAQCEFHVNSYDLVPQAWASLGNVLDDPDNGGKPWYPEGTTVTGELKELIVALERLPGHNRYVQPGPSNQHDWNTDYGLWDSNLTLNTVEDFMGQVAFQHANSTYLALLSPTMQLLNPPTVNAVTPNFGNATMSLDIIGSGFTTFDALDTAVDFGTIGIPQSSFQIKGDTLITVLDVPAGIGVVEVCVTNPLGTSAGSPAAQFAYGGPEPVRVFAVEPASAPIGSDVSIYGWGLTAGADVYFGKLASPDVKVLLPLPPDPLGPPYLVAKVPTEFDPKRLAGKSVDVTVTVNHWSSPHTPGDEFTYPETGSGAGH